MDISYINPDTARMDFQRKKLTELIAREDISFRDLSLAIGKNHAFIQQYFDRGTPKELKDSDRREIAKFFKIDDGDLLSPEKLPNQKPNLADEVPAMVRRVVEVMQSELGMEQINLDALEGVIRHFCAKLTKRPLTEKNRDALYSEWYIEDVVQKYLKELKL